MHKNLFITTNTKKTFTLSQEKQSPLYKQKLQQEIEKITLKILFDYLCYVNCCNKHKM